MHHSNVLLSLIFGMVLCGTASAQIYESKDAQGNTVYSDKPSHGAEQVDLSPTNTADPVAERPRPPPDSTPEQAQQRTARPANNQPSEQDDQQDADYYYYGGVNNNNNDGSADQREKLKQRLDDNVKRPNQDLPAPQRSNGSRARSGARGR